jgi:hypothetical protein
MIDLHVPPHKLNLPTLEGLKCGKTSDLRLDTLNKSWQCTIHVYAGPILYECRTWYGVRCIAVKSVKNQHLKTL